MGLLLLDGFEDLSSWGGGTGVSIVAGRNGNGLGAPGTSNSVVFNIPAADQTDTLTIGFAFKTAATWTSSAQFVTFLSDSGTTAHVNFAAGPNGAGSFYFLRGSTPNGPNNGGSGGGLFGINSWSYVEFQAKLSDTVGTGVIRVNGVTVYTATNVDTKNAGTKTVFDQVRFVSPTSTGSGTQFDDVYIRNDATFMGDLAVETLYPNGNGNANQWVGSDADSTNNYLHVDEVGAPVATDYVASSTSGQQDLYTMTDLVRTSGTVLGVTHQAVAAKGDSGARQFKIVNRRAADTKSVALDLTTSFAPYHYSLENDPETAAPFTIADVNAVQSGVEVV